MNRVKVRRLGLLMVVALICFAADAAVDQAAVDWIRQTAIPLATVEFLDGHDDLMALLPLFEGARVVALGEATHGTREFFTTRMRLIELLATELGVSVFAFEFPYGEGKQINEYVQAGAGDPKEILARVYCCPWNHEEMLSLIEWMRSYNATPGRARPLTFHGIDIHDGSSVLLIESILHFIARVDPARTDEYERALQCFHYLSMYHIAAFSDPDGTCRSKLRWVVDEIASGRSRYAASSSTAAYDTALHEARMLLQRAEFFALMTENPPAANDLRDASMAENVAWLKESLGSSGRIALGAHNYHVGRFKDHAVATGTDTSTQTSMGWHLSERYGDAYVVLATTTRTGRVAIFPFPGSPLVHVGDGRGLPQHESVELPRLRHGAVVDLLRAADVSPCVLDLRASEITPGTDWLFEDRPLLQFGTLFIPSIASSYMIQEPIAERFDLLLYIDRTTAPHMFPWTPWEALE